MKTCTEVKEYATYFDARGWTTSFHVGQRVYCVIKVRVPYDAYHGKYTAKLRWRNPQGELYHEERFKDLKRNYIVSIWQSITPDVAGQWQVAFSVFQGPSKTLPFSVSVAPPEDTSDLLGLDVEPPAPKLPDVGFGPDIDLSGPDLPPVSSTEPDASKGTATIRASITLDQQTTEGVLVCFKEGDSLTAVLKGKVAESYVIATEIHDGVHAATLDIAVGAWQVLAMKPADRDNEYWISEAKGLTFFKGFTYTIELPLTAKMTLE